MMSTTYPFNKQVLAMNTIMVHHHAQTKKIPVIRLLAQVYDHHGRIVQRAEIALRELSLAPTGTGLAKGAEVTALRSATTPRLHRLRQRRIYL